MTTLTIRKLPDEVHRALKVQAAKAGRSTEAELRRIIEIAVTPKLNAAETMRAIGQSFGGLEIEISRGKRAYVAPTFE